MNLSRNRLAAFNPAPAIDKQTVMTLLSRAINPEAEPQAPRPRRTASFNAQVRDLGVGESVCKMRPVDPTCSVERLSAELPLMREQVRNSTTPAVTAAKREIPGSRYSIEVSDLLTPSGRLFVCAVVTRES